LGWAEERLVELELGHRQPTLEEALVLTRVYVVAAHERLDEFARGAG
jgi:hypothetical protein